MDNYIAECSQCPVERRRKTAECRVEAEVLFGPYLIFTSITMQSENNSLCGIDVPVRLADIPVLLKIKDETFYFRGAVSTSASQQSAHHQRIGHYKAYCYREPIREWQLYDDLFGNDEHVKRVNVNQIIYPQVYFYSK